MHLKVLNHRDHESLYILEFAMCFYSIVKCEIMNNFYFRSRFRFSQPRTCTSIRVVINY